ncbi:putative protein SCO1, mitochondrial [Cocos nucifera]|nr:putative protein SCO1, mitochondrial [Cocos nucifera]
MLFGLGGSQILSLLSRFSGIPFWVYPFQSFQSRGYIKGTNYRDHKLPRKLPEDNELHSRSWGNYVIKTCYKLYSQSLEIFLVVEQILDFLQPTAVLVITGAGLLIHYNDEKRAIPKGSHQRTNSDGSKVNRPAIGGPFKLFDMENILVTESNLQGNWTLMYFGYTSSPDVGPEEVEKMAEVIQILESEHNFMITPVFVTIDPQRDSPAQLKAYLGGSHQRTNSDGSKVNRPAIGGPFKLFDMENILVTESNLQGNWTLMYFGYTSSPDVGPEEVEKMAEVIQILESEHNFMITPVFVTIDPQRDSPAQLKAYLGEFDSRIIGLTGPIASVRQMAQEYRVYFKKVDEEGQDYLVECSHNMYLLDPNMEILRCFGVEYDALQLSNAIMMEVKKASK